MSEWNNATEDGRNWFETAQALKQNNGSPVTVNGHYNGNGHRNG